MSLDAELLCGWTLHTASRREGAGLCVRKLTSLLLILATDLRSTQLTKQNRNGFINIYIHRAETVQPLKTGIFTPGNVDHFAVAIRFKHRAQKCVCILIPDTKSGVRLTKMSAAMPRSRRPRHQPSEHPERAVTEQLACVGAWGGARGAGGRRRWHTTNMWDQQSVGQSLRKNTPQEGVSPRAWSSWRRIRPWVWGGRGRGASPVLGGPDGQAAEPSPGSSGDRREQRGPAFIYIYIYIFAM